MDTIFTIKVAILKISVLWLITILYLSENNGIMLYFYGLDVGLVDT